MDQTYSNDGTAPSEEPIRCQLVPVPSSADNPLSIDNPHSTDTAPPPTLTVDLAAENAVEILDPTTKCGHYLGRDRPDQRDTEGVLPPSAALGRLADQLPAAPAGTRGSRYAETEN
jgi:hypothetical protein